MPRWLIENIKQIRFAKIEQSIAILSLSYFFVMFSKNISYSIFSRRRYGISCWSILSYTLCNLNFIILVKTAFASSKCCVFFFK